MFATITRYGTDDPVELANRIGINVRYMPLPTEMFALFYRTLEGTLFIVNSHLVRPAQRFVIAHMLGHVVKHPDRTAGILTYHDILNPSDVDIEATRFAVALLTHRGEFIGFASPCEYYEQFGYPIDQLRQAYHAIQRVR